MALERAHAHTLDWLASLDDPAGAASASIEDVVARLGADLPDGSSDPAEVVDLLASACEPGLTAMPSGRFFGFVIGGTHPGRPGRRLADQRVDQNSGLRRITPATPPSRT